MAKVYRSLLFRWLGGLHVFKGTRATTYKFDGVAVTEIKFRGKAL